MAAVFQLMSWKVSHLRGWTYFSNVTTYISILDEENSF
jgi:hypothetical protein